MLILSLHLILYCHFLYCKGMFCVADIKMDQCVYSVSLSLAPADIHPKSLCFGFAPLTPSQHT